MLSLLEGVENHVRENTEGLRRTAADVDGVTKDDTWRNESYICSGYVGGQLLRVCTERCDGLIHIGIFDVTILSFIRIITLLLQYFSCIEVCSTTLCCRKTNFCFKSRRSKQIYEKRTRPIKEKRYTISR